MFNYVAYRVYEYFQSKNEKTSVENTINFLALFQGTLIVPVFMAINLIKKIDPQIFGQDSRIKYYIGIPLAIVLLIVNNIFYKRKLKGEQLNKLKNKYHKVKYALPIWLIFAAPIIFVFVLPIAYGIMNGTLHVKYPSNK